MIPNFQKRALIPGSCSGPCAGGLGLPARPPPDALASQHATVVRWRALNGEAFGAACKGTAGGRAACDAIRSIVTGQGDSIVAARAP